MNYSDYKNLASSEKITLAVIEASRRLMGWTLHSGEVYYISDSSLVISSLFEESVEYLSVDDVSDVTNETYFHDKTNGRVYLKTSDGSNPNTKFLFLTFKLFYSSAPITLPWNLDDGYDVYWEPAIQSTSEFGVEMDTINQMGETIEGSGSLTLYNDQAIWEEIFDKYFFENHSVFIYSFNRYLSPSEAKLIFKGKTESQTYTPSKITFRMKDILTALREPYGLADLGEVPNTRIPESMNQYKQRMVLGRVYGYRPVNIDQVLDGYPVTGTISINTGSKTLNGSGTQFLAELSPDDRIFINGVSYSIESVTDNDTADLTEEFVAANVSGVSITIKPDRPKRRMNRNWFLAGHALREPTTTVVERKNDVSSIRVGSTRDIRVGDELYIGTLGSGEIKVVDAIIPGSGIIKFTSTFASAPEVGTAVRRPCVSNVKMNEIDLVYYRDYVVDAQNGLLSFNYDSEINASPIRECGIMDFNIGSRTVTGSDFELLFKPGFVIRARGQSDWAEVLSIESNTSLTLRTPATYSEDSEPGQFKDFIFSEGTDVVSLDILGRTDDNTPDGEFLDTAPKVVEQLIKDAGLEAFINTESFTEAKLQAPQAIGVAYPKTYSDVSTPIIRDIISVCNRSVFGTLIQDRDFKLKYRLLEPAKLPTTLRLREEDVLSLSVENTNAAMVGKVLINYAGLEYYYLTGEPYTKYVYKNSDTANYILKTIREKRIETILSDQSDAEMYAHRWLLLLERASSSIKITTKLQTIELEVNDVIDIEHEKLFKRLGGSSKRVLCLVEKILKSGNGVTIEAVNLSNAFNRVAIINENSNDYDDSSEETRLYSGFITDQYGMQDNDPDTFGLNIIW